MKTERIVSLKDFTLGLVLALAEQEVLVIDKPKDALHAALEAAYEAVRGDIENEQRRSRLQISAYSAVGNLASFEPAEVIDFALGARLMTCEIQDQTFGITRNERFTQAYFRLDPTRGTIYRKAARAFLDCPG